MAKVYAGLGGIVATFTIIGGTWAALNLLATDLELMAVAAAAETATQIVAQTHERDKVTQAEADKNDRVDRVNRDIIKQDRLLRGKLTPEDRVIEERVLADMKQLKQNILDGIE